MKVNRVDSEFSVFNCDRKFLSSHPASIETNDSAVVVATSNVTPSGFNRRTRKSRKKGSYLGNFIVPVTHLTCSYTERLFQILVYFLEDKPTD